ncbi:Hippocampus abundant transcript 1 protein [Hordeum vulgare]|uniref:Major facilitator superfamily (MFS) profile domain-containing protein n=1 Tax=Hordeum vulgare subsp. vulgare TaxID=112509 RepID=A0A8I6Y3C0_HORVV|nr:hippocampus abundant transcript 1 protein-like [Hordeum vulgare subsp. vulgare]KAE8798286.1 Hippocampus abundant transcript 1 protein [Hordeum vulgare]
MKDLVGLGHLFVVAFLFHFSSFMVLPAITDVTMEAVCPGRDECSVAIYLSGFQNAITGLGALVVTPIVGNLSDKYGRKALMTLPVTVAILPLFILACNRSAVYFYVYYVVKILAGIFCEGSIHCLSLAYVADHVGTKRRAAAFGLLSGVSAAGFLSGTLTARFLATSSTFQVAAAVGTAGAIYLRAFVPDSGAAVSFDDDACDSLLQDSSCSSAASSSASSDEELSPRLPPYKGVLPSPSDMVALLTGSLTLSTAAMITFFYSLGEHGLQTALLYYLKAQFGYSKDEFANLMLIAGAAGMISQLTVMPIFAPIVGEEMLLIVGLLGGCTHVFLYGIAWSYWVPYFAAAFIILSAFVHPSIRTNVSKSVGSNEQGIAQGCISGISSFASILAPLVFTPLTAWFLSETTPFNFKGFSIMVAGFCTLIAFVISIRMRAARCGVSEKVSLVQHEQA